MAKKKVGRPAKLDPKDVRSERMNLVFKKQLKEDFKTVAHIEGTTMNSLAHQIIEDYVEERRDKIAAYNKLVERPEDV